MLSCSNTQPWKTYNKNFEIIIFCLQIQWKFTFTSASTSISLTQYYKATTYLSYIYLLGRCLNPTAEDYKANIITAAQRSDAILYVEQHLDDVEHYLQNQSATDFTGRHYQQLLLQIKKIREKYESGK